ncbi:hypothetical protein N3K66_004929 [Trichothecium roseum]|uniref:Uncharacterized protein n=1 Tax=Trichothecium roseum TaxID=47278 RepID=A0ACC0V2S3_9HYPO|nr:hypothetical protein N3K66_004929 [Trichothecium roseum]
MPPALSDEEQSDVDVGFPMDEDVALPVSRDSVDARNGKVPAKKDDVVADEDKDKDDNEDEDEDEDDEDDDEEDVFVVEAIKKHMVDDNGDLRFQVKWEGYDAKKDMTWEPEENLAESAEEILNEYLESIGGREAIFDETAKASRGKKRARGGAAAAVSTASTGGTKRTKRGHPADSEAPASKKWSPPAGSWEDDVKSIDTCEEIQNKLMVFLDWKNGQKTKHPTEVIYKKCPQKMLKFYEKHVRIIKQEPQVDVPQTG